MVLNNIDEIWLEYNSNYNRIFPLFLDWLKRNTKLAYLKCPVEKSSEVEKILEALQDNYLIKTILICWKTGKKGEFKQLIEDFKSKRIFLTLKVKLSSLMLEHEYYSVGRIQYPDSEC